MELGEIIGRLENLSNHAIHYTGEPPFVMSLDDGLALREAIHILHVWEETQRQIKLRSRKSRR